MSKLKYLLLVIGFTVGFWVTVNKFLLLVAGPPDRFYELAPGVIIVGIAIFYWATDGKEP